MKLLSWNVRREGKTQPHSSSRAPVRSLVQNVLGISGHTPEYPPSSEGEQPWEIRKSLVADLIVWEDPDICCFQEVKFSQINDLASHFPQYDYIAVGRDDGKEMGECVPIFYRKSLFTLVAQTHFWLSETPEVPGKKGWGADCTRMVTVARLRPASKDTETPSKPDPCHFDDIFNDLDPSDIFVACTHYDHKSEKARIESSKLIRQRFQKLSSSSSNNLFILASDLNSDQNDGAYQSLVSAQKETETEIIFYDAAHNLRMLSPSSKNSQDKQYLHKPYGQTKSFTGFTMDTEKTLIDYIFVANNGAVDNDDDDGKAWKIDRFGILPMHFEYNTRASDHRPLVLRLSK